MLNTLWGSGSYLSSIFNSNYVKSSNWCRGSDLRCSKTLHWTNTVILQRRKRTRVAKEGQATAEEEMARRDCSRGLWHGGTHIKSTEGTPFNGLINHNKMSDEDFSSESWDFNPIKTMILNNLDATHRSVWNTSHLRWDNIWYSTTPLREAINTMVFVC